MINDNFETYLSQFIKERIWCSKLGWYIILLSDEIILHDKNGAYLDWYNNKLKEYEEIQIKTQW